MRRFFTLALLLIHSVTFSASDVLVQAIGLRESSGNYRAVNRLGYLGKYQFGGLALIDLEYKKGNQWVQGYSKEYFLSNPILQEQSAIIWFSMLERRLVARGALRYVGTVIGDVEVTWGGLIAASHLVGVEGVLRMLRTGVIPNDANGTKATEYLQIGATND